MLLGPGISTQWEEQARQVGLSLVSISNKKETTVGGASRGRKGYGR